MPRLYDRLMTEPLYSPPWNRLSAEEQDRQLQDIRQVLDNCLVFQADNVCEYFFAGNDKEYWRFDEFGCVAPPADRFWIEMRKPSKVVCQAGTLPASHFPKEFGFLFTTVPSREQRIYTTELVRSLVVSHGQRLAPVEQLCEARWMLLALFFTSADFDRVVAGPWANAVLWLNSDGEVISGTMYSTHSAGENLASYVELLQGMDNFFYPALMTLAFLHCRNVEVTTVHPPPALSKRFRRKHNRGLVSYKVLNIIPVQKVAEGRTVAGGKTGIKQALHICRGHFRTYKEGGPGLFGKQIYGRFFIPQHIRGSAEEGVIRKTYQVSPGRKSAGGGS